MGVMIVDPVQALCDFIGCKSISADSNFREGVQQAKEFVVEHLKELEFEVEEIKTPLHPILWATRAPKTKEKDCLHVLLYAHYDVQPADPVHLWHKPPFTGYVKEGKVYGRGACDNKGPLIAQLTGIGKLLKAHPNLPLKISFLIEGEEEIGSPSFAPFLEAQKERFKEVDLMLVSDTGNPNPKEIIVTTALRGMVELEVHVKGPDKDLHSGLFGGMIQNPIHALCEICASLHDKDGTVNVPGFYDDVLSPEDWEYDEMDKLSINEAELLKNISGVKELVSPNGFTPLEAGKFRPTLEINGIGGGYQGEGSKTVIASHAFAKITCRLVNNQNARHVSNLVASALKERAPKGVEVTVHQGPAVEAYTNLPPLKTKNASDSPILNHAFSCAQKACTDVFGAQPLYIRGGGSIPIMSLIYRKTGLRPIMIGLALNDDNAHSPNETFRIEMLEKGIALYENLLYQLSEKIHS